MTWGEEAPDRSDEFTSERLSSAEYLDTERTAVMGVSANAPEAEFGDESAGLVDVEASAGGSAWRRRVAPRHRGAVKSFFASPENEERR